jgi:hypothetical protein
MADQTRASFLSVDMTFAIGPAEVTRYSDPIELRGAVEQNFM